VKVRPRLWPLGRVVLGALVFTALGVWLIISGGLMETVAGLLLVVFFGGGTVLATLVVARRGLVMLTLTPAGIEVRGGLVPWGDIEAIGVARANTDLLGIRLSRYDRYLASMTPSDRADDERYLRWFFRPLAAVTMVLGRRRLLGGFVREVSSLESGLRWSRQATGWDMTFSPTALDRPLDQFIDFIEDYRRRANALEQEPGSPSD
jgi:hypothetical protein